LSGISYSELYEVRRLLNATVFQFVLKYNIQKAHQNEGGLELPGTRHLLVADYVNIRWQHKYHKHKQQIY